MGSTKQGVADRRHRPLYQPLVILIVPIGLGAMLDRQLDGRFAVWLLLAIVALAVWVCCWLKQRLTIASFCLLLVSCGVGGAWHHARWSHYSDDDVAWCAESDGRPVVMDAVVVDAVRWLPAPPENPLSSRQLEDRSRVRLRAAAIRDGQVWRSVRGRVTLTVSGRMNHVEVGDTIRVVGFLRKPNRTLNPGEFDFASFLRAQRELCSLSAPTSECVRVIAAGSEWLPTRWLAHIRSQGQQLLAQHIDADRASLAAAVLLGAREQLPAERTELFFTTGTIHLLAISGLHIGILASGIFLFTRTLRVSHRTTLLLVGVFVIGYALITDARPPVVRAAILIVMICCARVVRRHTLGFNTLAAAAMIVFAIHPAHLFQVGTQLSFLAVATLICIAPWLQWRLPDDPLDRLIAITRPLHVRIASRALWSVWQLWTASFIIWLIALPLVMRHFHLVSPAGLLLNPIIWIPISLALFSGFAVFLCGWICTPLARLFGFICDQNLAMIESSLQLSQSLPGSHFWTAGPSNWWMISHYVMLAILLTCPRLRPRWSWGIALLGMWLTIGILTCPTAKCARTNTFSPRLTCTFIAVGHGTCVLIECPDGSHVLYDAGHLGSPEMGARTIAAVLWSRGITRLRAIVISHADVDHYNAVPELLERFEVEEVFVSPVMFDQRSDALAALQQAIAANEVRLREVAANVSLHLAQDLHIDVLYPPPLPVAESDNANSIVLLVHYAGRQILLPGDIEGIGLAALLRSEAIDCDIAMAPHHGSANSRPEAFQRWAGADWVAISSGRHGNGKLFGASASCLETAKHGAIRFVINHDGRMACQHWTGSAWALVGASARPRGADLQRHEF